VNYKFRQFGGEGGKEKKRKKKRKGRKKEKTEALLHKLRGARNFFLCLFYFLIPLNETQKYDVSN